MKLIKISCAVLFINSMFTYAQTNIDFVKVQGELLILTTTTAKTHSLPGCVNAGTSAQWAINITTDEGRAALLLVNTAVSAGISIALESSGSCAGNSGIERAKNVVLVAPAPPSAAQ